MWGHQMCDGQGLSYYQHSRGYHLCHHHLSITRCDHYVSVVTSVTCVLMFGDIVVCDVVCDLSCIGVPVSGIRCLMYSSCSSVFCLRSYPPELTDPAFVQDFTKCGENKVLHIA